MRAGRSQQAANSVNNNLGEGFAGERKKCTPSTRAQTNKYRRHREEGRENHKGKSSRFLNIKNRRALGEFGGGGGGGGGVVGGGGVGGGGEDLSQPGSSTR